MSIELDKKEHQLRCDLESNHFQIVNIIKDVLEFGTRYVEENEDKLSNLVAGYESLMELDHNLSEERYEKAIKESEEYIKDFKGVGA